MFGLPSVHIRYRADKRIKVVEVRTGNRAFLTDLETFALETGIRDFEESTSGEAFIDSTAYTAIFRGRIQNAEPHSFRFRRAKKEG